MGKEGSLGKASKMQKKQIAACKAKKRKTTFNKVKNTVSKKVTKVSDQANKLKR
jgi:ribosomal protein S30